MINIDIDIEKPSIFSFLPFNPSILIFIFAILIILFIAIWITIDGKWYENSVQPTIKNDKISKKYKKVRFS